MSKKIQSTIEAWESGKLGEDESFVKVASKEATQALDDSLALKAISIRLPVSLINEFKMIADYNKIGYQPLIRKMLQRFANAELKKMAVELHRRVKADEAEEEETEEPKKAAG